MEVDLGRMLGMVIRGPLVGVLRGQLVESMPGKLKGSSRTEHAAVQRLAVNAHVTGRARPIFGAWNVRSSRCFR